MLRFFRGGIGHNTTAEIDNWLTTTEIGAQREFFEASIFDKGGNLLRVDPPELVYSLVEITDQVIHLVQTLEGLWEKADSGRLAVGYIHESFNKGANPEQQIKTPHAMGAMLRQCGLKISAGLHDANGKRAVRCLVLDKKANLFINNCLHSLQPKQNQGPADADFENSKSAKSANIGRDGGRMQTSQTLKNQSLQAGNPMVVNLADNSDNADFFSKDDKTFETGAL